MMKPCRLWLGTLAIAAWGCGAEPGTSGKANRGPEPPAPLRIAAASDLQNVLPVLAKRFTERNHFEVSLTFGASGQLAEQIKAGAPFDVFLAANQKFVKDLAGGGFVRPDSFRPYAEGSLVLAVHAEAGKAVAGLADLARPEIKKIALANPAFAPYGTAGKQALERSGLWPKIEAKIVQAESVRQALQFVQSGNAEAGLVGRAIARVEGIRVVPVDRSLYDPLIQGLGTVARTSKSREAEAFTRFVLGDEGQAILVDFGFAKVGPGGTPG